MRAAVSDRSATLTYLSSTVKVRAYSVTIDTGAAGSGAWCVLINALVSDVTPSVTIDGTPVDLLFTTKDAFLDNVFAAVYIIPAQGEVLLESTNSAFHQKAFLYRLEKPGSDASALIENQWAAGNTQTLSLTSANPGGLILAGSITANDPVTRLASPISEDAYADCNSNEYVSIGTAVDVASVSATDSVKLLFAVEF